MTKTSYFSAKLRFAVLVEPEGASRLNDSVYVFKAIEFTDAFERALKIGRAAEQEYKNVDGGLVQWRLMEVISLDIISADDFDGVEVYSEPIQLAEKDRLPFDSEFAPERSQPTQTI